VHSPFNNGSLTPSQSFYLQQWHRTTTTAAEAAAAATVETNDGAKDTVAGVMSVETMEAAMVRRDAKVEEITTTALRKDTVEVNTTTALRKDTVEVEEVNTTTAPARAMGAEAAEATVKSGATKAADMVISNSILAAVATVNNTQAAPLTAEAATRPTTSPVRPSTRNLMPATLAIRTSSAPRWASSAERSLNSKKKMSTKTMQSGSTRSYTGEETTTSKLRPVVLAPLLLCRH
jgi:hypothetical protein